MMRVLAKSVAISMIFLASAQPLQNDARIIRTEKRDASIPIVGHGSKGTRAEVREQEGVAGALVQEDSAHHSKSTMTHTVRLTRKEQGNVEGIKGLLATAKEFFTMHHIEYTLARGTLLGAVRECSIIPFDYDGDIHAFADPSVKSTLQDFANKKNLHMYNPAQHGKKQLNTNIAEGSDWVDITFVGDKATTDICETPSTGECAETVPCAIDDLVMACTSDAQAVLTHAYGDFMEPVPKHHPSLTHAPRIDKSKQVELAKQRRTLCRKRPEKFLVADDDGTITARRSSAG